MIYTRQRAKPLCARARRSSSITRLCTASRREERQPGHRGPVAGSGVLGLVSAILVQAKTPPAVRSLAFRAVGVLVAHDEQRLGVRLELVHERVEPRDQV